MTITPKLRFRFRDRSAAIRRAKDLTLQGLADPLISDHYALLRTRLQRLEPQGKVKRIVVVGSVRGDGATLTAINLGISIARENRGGALIVDANLRRPGVHRYLGLESEKGLSDHLIDGTPLEELILQTDTPEFWALPGGFASSESASDLLGSARMEKSLSEMAACRPEGCILITCAPVLEAPDALMLSPFVDGYLLVVRAHRTKRDEVRNACRLLEDRHLFGLILNDMRGKRSRKLI